MKDIQLKCECGKVRGVAHKVSPDSGNRIVCCCDDCQSFANFLGKENILDENGGTDIFQMSYANIEITEGAENLKAIKLTEKGLIRWYVDCCKTPVGNTMSAKIPFMGVVHNFMNDEGLRDENLGPVRAYAFIKKDSPAYHLNTPMIKIGPRILIKMVTWMIRDGRKPSSFFTAEGKPIVEPVVLK